MGLTESQRLLARLYTDATLRARFADDPDAVAAEFGLSPDDSRTLSALPLDQLDDFAGSLIRKRRGEVESLLPATAKILGESFLASLFRKHAREYAPHGIKKHRDDAVAFAGFLAHEIRVPPWLADLARWEAACLVAFDPARRFTVLRLAYRPIDLVLADSGASPRMRPTLVAWFRLSKTGRLHRVILSRPWSSPTSPLSPHPP